MNVIKVGGPGVEKSRLWACSAATEWSRMQQTKQAATTELDLVLRDDIESHCMWDYMVIGPYLCCLLLHRVLSSCGSWLKIEGDCTLRTIMLPSTPASSWIDRTMLKSKQGCSYV